MKKSLLCTLNIIVILFITKSAAFADICEKHTFAETQAGVTEYYFYSYGRTWDFTAENNLSLNSVTLHVLLAGPGNYQAHIQIKINDEVVASWDQNITTTYAYFTLTDDINGNLRTGDTISFFIYGGSSSTPGGAIQDGDNYLEICGEEGIQLGSDDVVFDFGSGAGVWAIYNDTIWAKLHSLSPEIIAVGDLDGNGEDDCVIDFGSGVGIWVYYNNTTWAKLHSLSPEIIATGDMDGNGEDDCVIDFGSGIGIWVYYDNTTWTKVHNLSPEIIATGDMDGSGQDDCIIDFGPGIGIYVLYNDAIWKKLNSLSSESISTGNMDTD